MNLYNPFDVVKRYAETADLAITPCITPEGLMIFYSADNFNFIDPRIQYLIQRPTEKTMPRILFNEKHGYMDSNQTPYGKYLPEWPDNSNDLLEALPLNVLKEMIDDTRNTMMLAIDYLYMLHGKRVCRLVFPTLINNKVRFVESSLIPVYYKTLDEKIKDKR